MPSTCSAVSPSSPPASRFQSELDILFNGIGNFPNSINVFFVPEFTDASAFGIGSIGGYDIAIADSVFSFNGGDGRLDTIAHEIGHNLGLGHFSFGAGGASNLMTRGGDRTVPDSIADIAPSGANLDQLTPAQIAVAQTSDVVLGIALDGPAAALAADTLSADAFEPLLDAPLVVEDLVEIASQGEVPELPDLTALLDADVPVSPDGASGHNAAELAALSDPPEPDLLDDVPLITA